MRSCSLYRFPIVIMYSANVDLIAMPAVRRDVACQNDPPHLLPPLLCRWIDLAKIKMDTVYCENGG